MNQRLTVAVLTLAAAVQLQAQFAGPNLFNQETGAASRSVGEGTSLRVHAGMNGVVETNVLVPGAPSSGSSAGQDLYGTEMTFGAVGSKAYKHTSLGASYEGSYRAYTERAYYNGSDHLAALEIHHQFSRKWRLVVRPTAGTMARAVGSVLAPSNSDAALYGLPNTELFDSRLYFTQGSADVRYQATPRLAFNFGGDGFFIRRQNPALIGVDGASARADITYRFTKRQTIGAEYNHSHFTYDRAFGTYDADSVALLYGYRVSRRWEIDLRAGGYRVESMGLRTVSLDPIAADLLGIKTGTSVGYAVRYLPQLDAVIRHTAKHGDVRLTYSQRLHTGNGILLLARAESAVISARYAVRKGLLFDASGGLDRLSGISANGAGFDSFTVGTGANYQIAPHAYLTARFDWRQYELVGGAFERHTSRAVIGMQYTSADLPIRNR